jgi:hypothetical protein
MTARRRKHIVHVEDLVGRRVHTADGSRIVGRIEELIVERRQNGVHEVTEYHIGVGALFERLAVVHQLLGRRPSILIARWDQLDISRPEKPTLTCAEEELRHAR